MSKKYVPEIYYEEKMGIVNGSIVRNESFEIQTTAYGPKSAEEIEKIIAGYQEAVEVVRILNKEFC